MRKINKEIKGERMTNIKTKKVYYFIKNDIVINNNGEKNVSHFSPTKISTIIEYVFKIVGLVANIIAIIQLFK